MPLILPLTPAATEFWDNNLNGQTPSTLHFTVCSLIDFITRENSKWKFLTNYLLLFRLKAALKDLQFIPSNTTGLLAHCSFDS